MFNLDYGPFLFKKITVFAFLYVIENSQHSKKKDIVQFARRIHPEIYFFEKVSSKDQKNKKRLSSGLLVITWSEND